MQGTMLYGPGDIRFEEVEAPRIQHPTDAIVRLAVTSVCGSDLWPYRGLQPFDGPTPMGHEYCGAVEEVGSAVNSVKPGQFVVGSFFASDNTCPHCRQVLGSQPGSVPGMNSRSSAIASSSFCRRIATWCIGVTETT